MIDYSIIVLAACLVAYLYVLWRGLRGAPEVKLYGPLAMVRCEKCTKVVERLARVRARYIGGLSVAVWIIAMGVGAYLLLESAIASLNLPPERAPSPRVFIGLPGINPLIPLWYGLVGLIIAVVSHELAHGIALRANGLKLKSVGLLILGLPIGAFVEPSEELERAKPLTKVKVYSAGPFANFAIAIVALMILSLLMVGVKPVAKGVGVIGVIPGSPAEGSGIEAGTIIVAVDDVRVNSLEEFLRAMRDKRAGERVKLTLARGREVSLILADKYEFTGRVEDRGVGFIGVSIVDVEETLAPILSLASLGKDPLNSLRALLLAPLIMRVDAIPYLKSFYTQPLGSWETVYILVWIAWMNAAVGLANVLPIVPFDGGNAFKAVLEAVMGRTEKAVDAIVAAVSVMTAALIAAPLIIPRVLPLFRSP